MSGTEFVVSAKLIADASEMVSGAQQGAAAIDRIGASSTTAAAGARRLTGFTAEQSAQMKVNAAAIGQVIRATNPAVSSQALLEAALRRVQSAYIAGKVGAETYARAQAIAARGAREFATSGRSIVVSAGQSRAGMQQLSYQIGDVSQQLALGVNPAIVFGQQFGQITQALALTRGAAGGFIGFLAGPWGAVITAAITVLGLFVGRLFESGDAATTAVTAAQALSQAQSSLGEIFDLTTGKINANTEALRLNALQTALNLRLQGQRQILEAQTGLRTATAPPVGSDEVVGTYSLLAGRTSRTDLIATGVRDILNRYGAAGGRPPTGAQAEAALVALANMELDARRQGYRESRIAPITAAREHVNNLIQGIASLDIGTRGVNSVTGNALDPMFRRHSAGGRPHRPRRTPDQTESGNDARDRITDITQRFTDTPPQVEAVRRALSDVDDIMRSVERRHPPNFKELLAQARAARPAIEAGINKPYNDFIQSQEESLRILGLQAAGRDDEAEALTQILRLEQQQGPLNVQQRGQILANVAALREQQRVVEILHQRQQLYLNALAETRKAITSTVEGVLGGNIKSLADLPRQMLQSFNRLTAERFVEMTFGPAFRQLEDEITGRNRVRQANEQLATTTDTATTAISSTTTAMGAATTGLDNFTGALDRAATAVSQPASGGGALEAPAFLPPGDPRAVGSDTGPGLFTSLYSQFGGPSALDTSDQDVVVQAVRSPLFTNPRQFFQQTVTGLLDGILGPKLAGLIGKGVGLGLEGAAVGGAVAGLGKLIGIKTSSAGGQIGGAIGGIAASAVGLPPIVGQLVGGLLGSVVGGVISGHKTGSTTITGIDTAGTASGTNAGFRTQSGALATSVQSGLQQIAEQLGGQLGAFAVSIGIRDGKYRVDPSGKGVTKTKKGAVDFGDDEAAAVMYAIMDAIKDGAITGLSPAVTKALQSSPDVDKAIREAMKVDEVETLLKGLGGTLEKQFKTFETQAAERLRIAAKYGFDLVKLEEINAKERAKLFDEILASRIGSLKDLIADLSFGDLFEGSLADRRTALIAELDKAIAEAADGIEGAADRQAQLSRDLLALSREAFGTAGPEYGSDLDRARTNAERVIELENQRVKAAQDAAQQTNTLLDENNAQNAEQTTILRGISSSIDELAAAMLETAGLAGAVVDTYRVTKLGVI